MFELWNGNYDECTVIERFNTLEEALKAFTEYLTECPEDIDIWVEDENGLICNP